MANFSAIPMKTNGKHTIAHIYEKGIFIDEIEVPIPGLHNLSNTIAAYGACRLMGLSILDIKKGIPKIRAPKRRFDFMGTWEGRNLIDDYAHHPTEVKAAIDLGKIIIKSKKSHFGHESKRLGVIFQPHRFSRIEKFKKDFANALSDADYIILAPVYAAGEENSNNFDIKDLAIMIKKLNPNIDVEITQNMTEVIKSTKAISRKNDLIITMGAGNINQVCINLIKESI